MTVVIPDLTRSYRISITKCSNFQSGFKIRIPRGQFRGVSRETTENRNFSFVTTSTKELNLHRWTSRSSWAQGWYVQKLYSIQNWNPYEYYCVPSHNMKSGVGWSWNLKWCVIKLNFLILSTYNFENLKGLVKSGRGPQVARGPRVRHRWSTLFVPGTEREQFWRCKTDKGHKNTTMTTQKWGYA